MATIIAVMATLLSATQFGFVQVYAQAHQHLPQEEYENDQNAGDTFIVKAKVITPAIEGHLSTCLVADDFTVCNERDIGDRQIVSLVEMSGNVYHIAVGASFQVCSDLRTYDGNTYHQCETVIRHANGHPEFTTIEVQGKDSGVCKA